MDRLLIPVKNILENCYGITALLQEIQVAEVLSKLSQRDFGVVASYAQ